MGNEDYYECYVCGVVVLDRGHSWMVDSDGNALCRGCFDDWEDNEDDKQTAYFD